MFVQFVNWESGESETEETGKSVLPTMIPSISW